MDYACKIQDQPAQTTVATRPRTPVAEMSQVLGEAYATIMQHMCEASAELTAPPYVAYLNMDMEDLDIEVGVPVSKPLDDQGNIVASELPACTTASCIHQGPCAEVGAAYAALSQWVKDQGYKPTGVAYEFYLNDPR